MEALEILRGLIERVSVRDTEKGAEVELVGEIANMVTLSAGTESVLREPYRSSVKVVAGERNQRYLRTPRSRIPTLNRPLVAATPVRIRQGTPINNR
jgi:hypothetical protein